MFFGENLRWLLRQKGIAPKEIAKAINVKVNTISNYTHGVSTPNYELLGKIVKYLDVSAHGLLYSDLSTIGLSNESASNIAPIAAPNEGAGILKTQKKIAVSQQGEGDVVFVSLKATAAYLKGCGNPEYIATLPPYRVPGFADGVFRMFEINGDSMTPTLKNRDKIIGKWCELADIKDANVCIIVTRTEGIIIKRVLNRIKKDGVFILRSDGNQYEYHDIIVNPADIIESWIGVGKISRDLSSPNDLYNRLEDAEERLAIIENQLKRK